MQRRANERASRENKGERALDNERIEGRDTRLSQQDQQRVHSILKKTKLALRRDSFSTSHRRHRQRTNSRQPHNDSHHPWQNDLFVVIFGNDGSPFSTAVWSKVKSAGLGFSSPFPIPRCGHTLTVVDMAPTSSVNTST